MVQQTVRSFVERELLPLESEVLQSEGKYPTGIEPGLYHTLQMKAMAKLYGSNMANRIADRVMQIHGGMGYISWQRG